MTSLMGSVNEGAAADHTNIIKPAYERSRVRILNQQSEMLSCILIL